MIVKKFVEEYQGQKRSDRALRNSFPEQSHADVPNAPGGPIEVKMIAGGALNRSTAVFVSEEFVALLDDDRVVGW